MIQNWTIVIVAVLVAVVLLAAIGGHHKTAVEIHRLNLEAETKKSQPKEKPKPTTKARTTRGRHSAKPLFVNLDNGEVSDEEGINQTGRWASL